EGGLPVAGDAKGESVRGVCERLGARTLRCHDRPRYGPEIERVSTQCLENVKNRRADIRGRERSARGRPLPPPRAFGGGSRRAGRRGVSRSGRRRCPTPRAGGGRGCRPTRG